MEIYIFEFCMRSAGMGGESGGCLDLINSKAMYEEGLSSSLFCYQAFGR